LKLIDRLIEKMEAMTLKERAAYIRERLEHGPARLVHEMRAKQQAEQEMKDEATPE